VTFAAKTTQTNWTRSQFNSLWQIDSNQLFPALLCNSEDASTTGNNGQQQHYAGTINKWIFISLQRRPQTETSL